jgi:exopolysaccharide production protein ExoY
VIDVVLSVAILIVLLPIMVASALLVRIVLGAPIIFTQSRVGFKGELFVCYKFRTMAVSREDLLQRHLACDPSAAEEWRATRKLRLDPRVGCLGRALRKSSLDELPQLVNVLRGDMSLVGPRPIVSEELARYGRSASDYVKARPGLTGMWQASGRSRSSYARRVAFDRYYVRHWSLFLDLRILIRTIPALLRFDHAA